jgi:hypothetical protein
MTTESTLATSEQIANLEWDNQMLTERLVDLELELEREGWISLLEQGDTEFSREGIRAINKLARLMYLKNPLIQRGVNVQAYYVFGQGVEIGAEDEELNAIIQAFMDDAKNQTELTSHTARVGKETELTLFGNLFFAFFVDSKTGRVRVRTLPCAEIDDIITNPEDAKDPWWYKRTYRTGAEEALKTKTVYYKDWRYMGSDKPTNTDGSPVDISPAVVYHLKVGGLPDMKFGVSEVYAAMDWAKAYKNFLEDWSTIVRAYARFAMQITVKTKAGMVRARSRLQTTIDANTGETNPPPTVGSMFISSGEGIGVQPIRTAGATTSADDARRLLLMVASTMGLPETFFGDVSVGTLATARSLDRPTELKFASRRTLWADAIRAISYFVAVKAVEAGQVPGARVIDDEDGEPTLELAPETDENGEEVERNTAITVAFPPILEHDVQSAVEAIVKAATLGGSVQAGTIDQEDLSRMLLTALNEENIEAVLEKTYPEDEDEEEEPSPSEPPAEEEPDDEPPAEEPLEATRAEAMMIDAVTELRGAIAGIVAHD